MSKVFIERCESYDWHHVSKAIENLMEMLDWRLLFEPGSKVLLKPNLLSARSPEKGVTTRPVFIEAVAKVFLDHGCTVGIGDSPGGAHKYVQRVWDKTGISALAKKLDIELVNFERSGAHRISRNGYELAIARSLDRWEFIINLPRLKTHSLMTYTGAVKNMFGIVPGFRKSEYHSQFPTPHKFGDLLTEVFAERRPVFNIMDGIVGMEGNGPSSGELRKGVGLVIASQDAVALDRVAERIIGLKKPSITTRIANLKGYGIGNLSKIEVAPNRIDDYILKRPFKLPPTSKLAGLIPSFIAKPLASLLWIRPYVVEAMCTKCGKCVKMCPVDAISFGNETALPEFDYDRCVLCLCCHEICPSKAIDLEKSRFAKLMVRT